MNSQDNVLPKFNPDGTITFPSQQSLDLYLSAHSDEWHSKLRQNGFGIAVKQAMEVVECFPQPKPGQNEFSEKLFAALVEMREAANPNLFSAEDVKEALSQMYVDVKYIPNDYPIQAIPKAVILSIGQLVRSYLKHKQKKDSGKIE